MKKTIYEKHNDWRDDFVPIEELSECDEGYCEALDEAWDCGDEIDCELIEVKDCDRNSTYWSEMSYNKYRNRSVADRIRAGE